MALSLSIRISSTALYLLGDNAPLSYYGLLWMADMMFLLDVLLLADFTFVIVVSYDRIIISKLGECRPLLDRQGV